jgi:hypothetical protein
MFPIYMGYLEIKPLQLSLSSPSSSSAISFYVIPPFCATSFLTDPILIMVFLLVIFLVRTIKMDEAFGYGEAMMTPAI